MGYGDMGGRGSKMQAVVLPTAPRATRSLNVDDENIPKNPPFNAYISNLQYDVDEEEIADFFKDMKVCCRLFLIVCLNLLALSTKMCYPQLRRFKEKGKS